MKTNEFIKRVEELGFEVLERQYLIEISSEVYGIAAIVGLDKVLSVDTTWGGWDLLPKIQKVKLFDLLLQYARTPIEEREEEKKYYLRHKWLEQERFKYLSCNVYTLSYGLGLKEGAGINFKTRFTLKEIEEIKEKYNTDLSDFELVEVEE